MTCPELRRKWWHRVVIGVALLLATVTAGAAVILLGDGSPVILDFLGGKVVAAVVVFVAVFFAIFVPYRILVRVVAGKISS